MKIRNLRIKVNAMIFSIYKGMLDIILIKSKGVAVVVILSIATFSLSCQYFKEHSSTEDTEDIVKTWIGKEIKFPLINTCTTLGNITPCKIITPKPYRVLLYTDSNGCVSCDLRIDQWKKFVKEIDTLSNEKVDFLFYFFPKKENNLTELFKRENFKNEVYIDYNDKINSINKFPSNMKYQCFLLDKNNNVLLVGNPTLNDNVWELYKNTILNKVDK